MTRQQCRRALAGAALCTTLAGSAWARAPRLLARPIGVSIPGGYQGSGPMGGPLLGVDGAWSATLKTDEDRSHQGWALGMRAGWLFDNGLDVHVRYDSLGVTPAWSTSTVQLATAGLRYSAPFLVPFPFAEVNTGAAFVGGDPRFGASAGVGLTLPFGHHLLFDLLARDWLVPGGSSLRQTVTAGIGLTVTFASPGH